MQTRRNLRVNGQDGLLAESHGENALIPTYSPEISNLSTVDGKKSIDEARYPEIEFYRKIRETDL